MKQSESIFVDREFLREIDKFVKKGKIKLIDDKYTYSTKNIQLPLHFDIEDIFLNDGDGKTKLPSAFCREKREQIASIRNGEFLKRPKKFFYNKHNEFMHLNDFLEFYDKFMEKRKVEIEKLHYKRKFTNEVQRIKKIKTEKFMETERIKLGGIVSPEEMRKLENKLKMFEDGLNYAINNMNYKQAERMLRKLNTLPQPPLKISLGYRTRLYKIKTAGNLDRALSHILEEREKAGKLGELGVPPPEEIKSVLASKGSNYGDYVKRTMQSKIKSAISEIDDVLANKRTRSSMRTNKNNRGQHIKVGKSLSRPSYV